MTLQNNIKPHVDHAARLAALRAEMAKAKVDAFIIPYADRYASKFPVAGSERLEWLTGFRGSAGYAVVLASKAVVLTDGRYTLAVRAQVDGRLYEYGDYVETPPQDWAVAKLDKGAVIGYDPWLHAPGEVTKMEKAASAKGMSLKPVEINFIDIIRDEKILNNEKVIAHDLKYSGLSTTAKLDAVTAIMKEDGVAHAIVTKPDSISWLLNLRAPDLPFSPAIHGYAVVDAEGRVDMFSDADLSGVALGNSVAVHGEDSLPAFLAQLAARGGTIGLDEQSSPSWFRLFLENNKARVKLAMDPCTWPKAQKNNVEQQGIIAAHVRDGAALVRFLCWLDGALAKGGLDELAIAAKINTFRAADPLYTGPSFDPIVGFNKNGASIHSNLDETTNQRISGDGLILIDSGGQYYDATTDVTRTVAVGEPSRAMKQAFTVVLKSHIALASAVFPEKTSGTGLDAIARAPLWREGMDFAHGTGHGVGLFLNVHEGPCNISPRGPEGLRAGLLMSNEPGFYLEGQFGIRTENLQLVVPFKGENKTPKALLCFEAVTLAPIDTRAVLPEMLDQHEIAWLNAYHARVLKTLSPLLDAEAKDWLETRCAAL